MRDKLVSAMRSTSSSDVDVDRLMYEIRETVARTNRNTGEISPNISASESTNGSSANDTLGSLSLQPAFQLRPDNQYHINDLLRFHGQDFVRNAYRALLLREPDQAGMAQHLAGLASGQFNKIDVLGSLRSSTEGRRTQVKVKGLWFPLSIRRLGRLPFFGYFIRITIALCRLPVLLEHQRQSEFTLWTQQQRVVDHQNQSYRQLSGSVEQLSGEIVSALQRSNEQQLEQLTKLTEMIEVRFARVREDTDQVTVQLKNEIQATEMRVHQKETELQKTLEEHLQQLQSVRTRQHKNDKNLLMQERRLTVLLDAVKRNALAASNSVPQQVLLDEQAHLLDSLYAALESRFRGEHDEVKKRLEVYLPFLKNAGITDGVLDVGSGGGEWLELLKSSGISARGVDVNRVFIEDCTRAGLEVVEDDAVSHLRSLPGGSLSCVTSFHLVEHLPFEKVVKLLDEIIHALKPGGLCILETPNPENFIVGSCNFYADPTHRNPIPSQTLQFLLEARGFVNTEVMKLRPWVEAQIEGDSEIVRRFNEYFYSAPDYGIISRKPLT